MTDINDMLQGVGSQEGDNDNNLKKTNIVISTKISKPAGMSREVFALIGNTSGLHPIVPSQIIKPINFKDKRANRDIKWSREPFLNVARDDDLQLFHWVRANQPIGDYYFSRYNIHHKFVEYLDDEYIKILEPTSTYTLENGTKVQWSKKETDLLFELCRQYNHKWIVIADRYNHLKQKNDVPRSSEDLQFRYFEILRLLTEARNKENETDHNKLHKDEHIKIKIEKSSQMNNDNTKSKDSTDKQLVKTPEEDTSKINIGDNTNETKLQVYKTQTFRYNIEYEMERKKQLEELYGTTPAEEEIIRKLQEELKEVEQELKKSSIRADAQKKKEMVDITLSDCRKYSPGVFLRSTTQMIPPQVGLSKQMTTKMNLILRELNVPERPLPTEAVCAMYDTLRQNIIKLLSLQKIVSSKEAEAHDLCEKAKKKKDPTYVPLPFFPDDTYSSIQQTVTHLKSSGKTVIPSGQALKSMKSLKRKGSNASNIANKRKK